MSASTIPALLDEQARRHGSTVAIAGPDTELTYAELHAAARTVTRAAMAIGVRHGDRIAIWAPNSAHWITTALGLLGAGATLVPIGTRLRGAEAADILRRARCRGLFTVRGFLGIDYPALLDGHELPGLRVTVELPVVPRGEYVPARSGTAHDGAGRQLTNQAREPLSWSEFLAEAELVSPSDAEVRSAATSPGDVSDILFTSGTTGTPKGVLSTHGNTLTVLDRWASAVTLRHGDRYLLINPFSHTFGYKAGIVACLLRAATMVPVDVFDAHAAAEVMAAEAITVLSGPPTVFTDLLRVGRTFPALRLAGTGGAAIPGTLVDRIRDELGADEVFTAYGLTESIGVISVCAPGAPAALTARTVGKALPGSEIRILDPDGIELPAGAPGEIVVRGPNVMSGYLDDPDATARAVDPDGWLHTGDIGTLDADGCLRITDRLKNMFIVGGFNVYPAEVEQALLEYPGITDAAVIGIPDDRLGEVAAAFVVTVDAAFDVDALVGWCRDRLAGYKVPRAVRVVDRLPRNTTGKIRTRDLHL
ncbi:putative AMP-dependent ligase [Nocardia nova SH22a]|uniref:Putative AMP-dependent ligase n=1 Tax=Nocardia nova SH22a TaxID=1415166 RepID=W5TNE8_9NOCA|nr:AMP-binding protein [Nocardia nova]AHH20674.1 putative AMP-dependent ligase [Nocardia nova SH22a]